MAAGSEVATGKRKTSNLHIRYKNNGTLCLNVPILRGLEPYAATTILRPSDQPYLEMPVLVTGAEEGDDL